jgi:hypothetical protein
MKKTRALVTLAGVFVSCLSMLLTGHPALAQALPSPAPSAPGLDQLLSNPAAWLTAMFNSAVLSLGQKTTGDVVGFMNWIMGNGNVVSQTPAELSYDNPAVANLWGSMRLVGNAALAVVTVWGGINMMVHPHIRAPYHGALELVPRVLLGGIMVNTSLGWGRFVVELNNALCRAIGGAAMPAWGDMSQQPADGPVLLNLIAMAIYLVMGLLLMGQMLMRLALVDALLVIAPLALLCWVLPQTYSWARLWFSTFFGTVFVQSIQVLVLRLGADLIQRLPPVLSSFGSNPVNAAHVWLATLLLGMAVLQLARKVPRLMQGVPAGMGTAYSGPSIGQITALFNSGKTNKGGK